LKILSGLKNRSELLKKEIKAVYLAYRHPGMPLLPKIIVLIAAGYALSPIDLIPDFIPVLGYVDDIIILPALIALAVKVIPPEIMNECRIKAGENNFILKKNMAAAVIIVVIWILITAFFAYKIFRRTDI